MKQLDCGDNSCYFAKEKTGMRTNGGCRCFSGAGFSRSPISAAMAMLPELLELRESDRRKTEALQYIKKQIGSCAFSCDEKFGGLLESVYRETRAALGEKE